MEKNRRKNMLNQLKTSLRQADQGLKGEGPSQKCLNFFFKIIFRILIHIIEILC